MTSEKIAFVTGASSGMGKEMAKRLLVDGLTVIAAARRIDQMQDLADLGAHIVGMDVADEASVTRGVDQIIADHGHVDILVNNAGFGLYGAVEDIPLEDARYQFEVNLFGLARLTQLFLPSMRDRQSGRIINITSMGGRIYTPLGAWYHASKHAVEGFSDCLRIELAPFGIDVVVIEPGLIATEFGNTLAGPMQKYSGDGPYGDLVERIASSSSRPDVTRRFSDPSLVAETVATAAGAARPRTRYVVGHMARPLMLMRKYLGDRLFDRIVMSVVS